MSGDAHIHIFMNGSDYRKAVRDMKDGKTEEVVRRNLRASAEAGLTFLRDGGDHYGASALARKLAPEYGIDYITPIYAIHRKNHYGKIVGYAYETFDEYRDLVKNALAQGADFIKIMVSGILDFDKGGLTENSLPADEIGTLIRIAHEEGAAIMVHTNGAEAVRAVIRAGGDSVEHGNFMDDACIEELAKSRTIYVPTLSTIRNLLGEGRFPDEITGFDFENQRKIIRKCLNAGVTMAIGSDAGAYAVPHGQGALDERAAFYDILGAGPDVRKCLDEGLAAVSERFRR